MMNLNCAARLRQLRKILKLAVRLPDGLEYASRHTYIKNSQINDFVRSLHHGGVCVDDLDLRNYTNKLISEYNMLVRGSVADSKRLTELQPIIDILNKKKHLEESLDVLNELKGGAADDKEFGKMAENEEKLYKERLAEINSKLLEILMPAHPDDSCSGVVLEVMPGVGGQEAMLFARELFDMYQAFAAFQKWQTDLAALDTSEGGGVRHASLLVQGAGAYSLLRHEAGVHRVQRIPATEKAGRIHTSTVAVAVMPQPSEVEVILRESDLEIETKRASGAGGQHVNTTDSAVRITHRPTGIVVESQVDRSQHKNKAIAMERLRARIWKMRTEEEESRLSAERKSQIGMSMRSDKIRTYNFQRDTVVDHRIHFAVHNLREFLEGGLLLNNLMRKLQQEDYKERLFSVIHS
ncbi:peptide chain release factor 1-like, mitochondrial [Schistocerca piceifrons]|uniref:peptide chain release factor 1-like, mitochondrial n=1 Tax=Schistocerca piceifrons TaxID=274613 RepID=UPI001F5E9F99|nr:peptide chain release factor 1-like, mitochondrial [Schistocerca piceifrons]